MLKVITHAFITALLIALAAASSLPMQAAESSSPAAETVEKENKFVRVPFRGKVASIDKQEMTLSLEGKEKKRVIHVTAQTKITKAGAPAKLSDAVVGEEIGGLLQRVENGKEEALSLRLGEKPATKPADKPSRSSR
jgi:hypothetical protein